MALLPFSATSFVFVTLKNQRWLAPQASDPAHRSWHFCDFQLHTPSHLSVTDRAHSSCDRSSRQNVLQPPQLGPSPVRRSPLLCLARRCSGLSQDPIKCLLPNDLKTLI